MYPMKPIVKVPSPVLTDVAKPVVNFDKRLSLLIQNLKETLVATKNPKGVGLAAPQIGESYRVFVTRPTERDAIRVFINPVIVTSSPELTDGVPERTNKLEGCLSIPAIWGRVKRATSLTLKYQDESGNPHEELFKGFIATIIQHETDHLNGTLFTHRVLSQQGKFYQSGKDEEGKEVLEEIELK
jgi:peptide deformylase